MSVSCGRLLGHEPVGDACVSRSENRFAERFDVPVGPHRPARPWRGADKPRAEGGRVEMTNRETACDRARTDNAGVPYRFRREERANARLSGRLAHGPGVAAAGYGGQPDS